MKTIITALCNPILNEKLRENSEFALLTSDIQYQEGIFEFLENNKKIDFLIISELIPGKYEINKLIKLIKNKNNNLKIILILENKNEELENYLYSQGVFKIYYNNQVKIEEIIELIKNNYTENEKIIIELENLKNILIKNNIDINNKITNSGKDKLLEGDDNSKIIKRIINRVNNKINNKNNKVNFINKKIISILGTSGVGKSVATVHIANLLSCNNYKVLILDFDILNNSLHTLLGVDKYPEIISEKILKNDLISSRLNIKELVIKINNQVDLISGLNLLFDSKYQISSSKINNILEELRDYYDYIIIDNSSECFLKYTKNIIESSDFNIFLIESNIVEIKKAKRWLEIYDKEWNINRNKINILINKYNKYSIKDNIIKNIFYEYNILGKIKFEKKNNRIINNNYKKNKLLIKKINNQFKKVLKIKEE